MGLCKCPKRKVTNQFCFEHRVNVCEHCMVASHAKCVVQSYLAWLQVLTRLKEKERKVVGERGKSERKES